MNAGYIISIVWLFVFLGMMGLFNLGRIKETFNLVDKRRFISDASVWEKFNTLSTVGTVELSDYSWSDKHYRLTVTYKPAKGAANARASFDGTNINELVEEAYKWSQDQGFIK